MTKIKFMKIFDENIFFMSFLICCYDLRFRFSARLTSWFPHSAVTKKNAQHETKSQYSAETWPVFHFFKHQWTIQKCNNFTTFRVSTNSSRFHDEELLAFHTNYSDTHSRSLMISSTTLTWSKLSINFVHETKIVINLRVQNQKYE